MKRFYSNVGATKASLQQAPEVCKAVRVDARVNVAFCVINNAVNEVVAYFVISDGVICVNLRSVFDVLQQNGLQGFPCDIRDHFSANLTEIAVKDSLHDRLTAMYSAFVYQLQLAILVHVLCESANKRFIRFKFRVRPTEFCGSERSAMQSLTNPLEHEPCRALSHPDSLTEFIATDPVLASDQHPDGDHPLIKTDGGILEHGFNLDGKLLLAVIAEPDAARLDKRMLLGTATWAEHDSIRPTQLDSVVEGPLRIGEVDHRFLERFGSLA